MWRCMTFSSYRTLFLFCFCYTGDISHSSELPIVLSQWASCFADLVSTFQSGRSRTNIHRMFCSLLSPQALIRTVPALYCYSFYAICLNPSSSIFFAALISLSWFVPQTGHIHSLTDRFFVSVFWYPQAEHS